MIRSTRIAQLRQLQASRHVFYEVMTRAAYVWSQCSWGAQSLAKQDVW